MENSTKCPVCGKEVPDYHLGGVRCQSCGSNLEVFRLLDAIEDENKAKASKWKPIALASMALALLFAILFFAKGKSGEADDTSSNKEVAEATANDNAEKSNEGQQVATAQVPTEETTAKSQQQTVEEPAANNGEITAPANKVTVKDGKKYYTVKSGDTWSKIARNLYGGKVSYEELARMNNRNVNKSLEIGEELIVK